MSASLLSPDIHDILPTDAPPPGLFQTILRGLEAHTIPRTGPAHARPLAIPVRDPDGTVTGGLWATTAFQWLYIQLIFLPESRRGRGLGAALLNAAEAEAHHRGCVGAHVTAWSWQAAPFYEKRGYTLFGTLRDYPPGHDLLHFRKRLDMPNERNRQILATALDRGLAHARSLAARGESEAARDAYEEVLRLDPTHEAALTESGELAWACGHREKARTAWLEAMRQRLAATNAGHGGASVGAA